MWFDIFCDKAKILIEDRLVKIQFTHWSRKRKSFTIKLDEIYKIEVMQIEPAIMELIFTTNDKLKFIVSEDMIGWENFIVFLKKNFSDFDFNAYEMAKGEINSSYCCWICKK